MEMRERAKIHVHGEFSVHDGLSTRKIMKRIAETGAKAMSLTDHGTLMGILGFMESAKEYGLKPIPGVEAYVEEDDSVTGRMHLLLLAKDYSGYKKIMKAVSRSNGNIHGTMPCMNKKIIEETLSGGGIYASSACMNGVLSTPLLINKKIEKSMEKKKKAMNELTRKPSDESYIENKKLYAERYAQSESLKAERDEVEKLSKKKFTREEKAIQKLEIKAASDASLCSELEVKRRELVDAKALTEEAVVRLGDIKQKIESLKLDIMAVSRAIKDDEVAHKKYYLLESELQKLRNELVPENQIYEKALEEAKWYDKMFGHGNFFAEVQYHGIEEEAIVFPQIARIAKELDLPMIATNDIHMAYNTEEDRRTRQILRSQRYNKWERENAGDDQLYVKTDDELRAALLTILDEETVEKAFAGLDIIEENCNVDMPHEEHYPKYIAEKAGESADQAMERKAIEGIYWRYPNLKGWTKAKSQKLKYELGVISKMGYSDYHLIVADLLEYGRLLGVVPEECLKEAPTEKEDLREFVKERGFDTGLGVGPGRGSAVGSLACYLLGITDVDPTEYDLLFERFLNIERVSMPDIDSDFSPDIRERVIEYVKFKYGSEAVCCITTKGTRAARSAVKSYARVAGSREFAKYKEQKIGYRGFDEENDETLSVEDLSDTVSEKMKKKAWDEKEDEYKKKWLSYADTVCNAIPKTLGVVLGNKIEPDNPNSKTYAESIKDALKEKKDYPIYEEIIDNALLIEGSFSSYGMHAAGVIISDNSDVSDYIPLMWNSAKKQWSCQCDMVQAEKNAGLLKMDFLGLKNLKIISQALRMIKSHVGKVISFNDMQFEKEVFRFIYAEGNTNFIFQFESEGMKKILVDFKPDCIEDIILLNAAYRPGPMKFLEQISDVKNKRKPISYLTPELEPILCMTYGCIIYQEQVMAIFQDLAGYSLGQADLVRRAMSKKKMSVLEKEREAFVNGDPNRKILGCKARGIDEKKAVALFEDMTDFARYAFNKSHAAAYAIVSYQTAWLKYHYPKEYLSAVMNVVDLEKTSALVGDCKIAGVTLIAPDINMSKLQFDSSPEKPEIYFGLEKVKNVGQSAGIIIERRKEGKFVSFKDFVLRAHTRKDVTESLIKSGAFDAFSESREALLDALERLTKIKKLIDNNAEAVEECEYLLANYSERAYGERVFHQIKNFPKKRETLESKLTNSKKALAEAREAYDSVTVFTNSVDDMKKRLLEEQEMLGIYVSAHPLDEYKQPEHYNSVSVKNVIEGQTSLFGVIKNLEVKDRKIDGKKMAFFELEDKTGVIPVCCFTKAFEKCGETLVREGNGGVVRLAGKCVIDKNIVEDIDEATGEIVEKIYESSKFYTESVETVRAEKSAILLSLKTAGEWKEKRVFISKFEAKAGEEGHPLNVFLEDTKKVKPTTVFVSRDIFSANKNFGLECSMM